MGDVEGLTVERLSLNDNSGLRAFSVLGPRLWNSIVFA